MFHAGRIAPGPRTDLIPLGIVGARLSWAPLGRRIA